MFEELTEKIKDISRPFLQEIFVDLIELKVRRQGRAVVIQILADRPSGGITMEECSRLNRKICEKIEMDGIFLEEYTLEVSSPGVDRPLKMGKDFSRVIGRRVRIHLSEPLENRIEYEGQVNEIFDNQVIINRDEHSIAIPIEKITLARQVIE